MLQRITKDAQSKTALSAARRASAIALMLMIQAGWASHAWAANSVDLDGGTLSDNDGVVNIESAVTIGGNNILTLGSGGAGLDTNGTDIIMGSGSVITDGTNTSIDPYDRKLYSGGNEVFEWDAGDNYLSIVGNNILKLGSGGDGLDTNGTDIIMGSGSVITDGTNTSIDPNNKQLYDGGVLAADWYGSEFDIYGKDLMINGGYSLYIQSGGDLYMQSGGSIHMPSGSLITDGTNTSIDPYNRTLYASNGASIMLDWSSGSRLVVGNSLQITDSNLEMTSTSKITDGTNTSIDPYNRKLYASDGTTMVLDWSGDGADKVTISVLQNSTEDILLGDSLLKFLSGAVITDGTNTSIDPYNRKLYGADGTTVMLDWSQSGNRNISMNGAGIGGTGTDNFASGNLALFNNTTGQQNIANGSEALISNTTGSNNIANGFYALYDNTSGHGNIALGYQAGDTGDYSYRIALGYATDVQGDYAIAIGSGAAATADNAVSIGHGVTNAVADTVNIGTNSATYLTLTASGISDGTNTSIDPYNRKLYGADGTTVMLDWSQSANYNISMNGAGNGGSGQYNFASGNQALFNNTTGSNNIANGYQALISNTTGQNNIANGYYALYDNTSGHGNIALGYQAAQNGDYSYRTALGYNTDVQGDYAIAIGSGAAATAGDAVAIGHGVTNSVANTVNIGTNSTTYLTLTSSGIADPTAVLSIDHTARKLYGSDGTTVVLDWSNGTLRNGSGGPISALSGNVAGNLNMNGYNLAFPTGSLITNGTNTSIDPYNRKLYGANGTTVMMDWSQSANYNISMNGAGNGGTGTNNFASGPAALASNTTGGYNIASGREALYSNTTGNNNIATGGYRALYSNTTGDYNIASGYQALYSNTTGSYNIASGYSALHSNTIGSENIVLGRSAGATGATNSYRIAIGSSSVVTVDNGIAIGRNSSATGTGSLANGYGASAGGTNGIAIGTSASSGTGASNVVIGGSATIANSITNSVAIGQGSAATASNTFSVGASGSERKITNVAAGTADTDAVNKSQLDAVSTTASTANTTANTALTNAATAQTTANTALANAATAQTTANTALTNAATAQTTANTALSTANTAAANAATALSTATSAVTTANTYTDSVAATTLSSANTYTDSQIATISGSVGTGTSVSGTDAMALGNNATATGAGAVATGADATATGTNAYAAGNNASANNDDTVAIGSDAEASFNGSVAIGAGARAVADPTTAVGNNAQALGVDSVAYGANSTASADNASAIGTNSSASGANSVALGQGSQATRANTVSVGNSNTGLNRQITGVANGVYANDAVNVGQLNGAIGQTKKFAAQGVAAALAATGGVTPPRGKQSMGLHAGTYGGESALGFTYSYHSEDDIVFSAAVSGNPVGGSVAARAGADYVW